jgi:hypothetical protein
MAARVRLTGWVPWHAARQLPEAARPGVYVLAHFNQPPQAVRPTDGHIIYIGETCDQTLRQRWARFDRSAFRGLGGHSGGRTYYRIYHGKRRRQLFVAFTTPGADAAVLPYRIRYLERKWLLDFVLTHGRPPRCKRK